MSSGQYLACDLLEIQIRLYALDDSLVAEQSDDRHHEIGCTIDLLPILDLEQGPRKRRYLEVACRERREPRYDRADLGVERASVRLPGAIQRVVIDDPRAVVAAVDDEPAQEIDEVETSVTLESGDDVEKDAFAPSPEEYVSGMEVGVVEAVAARTPSARSRSARSE